MTYYVQTVLLTLIEALCCHIFQDSFLTRKSVHDKWKNRGFFLALFLGFTGIALFPADHYLLKAVCSILLISVITYLEYRGSWIHAIFLAAGYYGLVLCIDRIMLILIQAVAGSRAEVIFQDSVRTTVIALLCKTVLIFITLLINRMFRLHSSVNLLHDKEWIRFLFFPVMTILCMSAFAVEGGEGSKAVLVTAFVLVLSNFLLFYIIRDVVDREKSIQEMKISQERIRNQMDLYRYMETAYGEQRKKTHEFKNHLSCLLGLIESGNYQEARTYIENVNQSTIEETDYINTNNAVINSILNQKFRQARGLGIPILFSINNLAKISIDDKDMVTLLANLLDNAIEACEKITEGSRVIKLLFRDEEGKITIVVRNPVAEPVKYTGKDLVTTKDNADEHGIGMMNIQNVVSKYGGENVWSCKEGYFTHSVVIEYSL